MPTDTLQEIDDLRDLFLNDVPLLDVRAPVEFSEGAFPTARNHPLIGNEERHQIGITYKEHGQDAAIALGERLVSGENRRRRIAAWQGFLEQYPNAALYCFRGGMRSKISQRWLSEHTGIECPRVRGGYKAMRRFLLEQLAHDAAACKPVVIGGRTGVGKTRLLADYRTAIDLERLAHHRGSAFGHHPQPQPSQVDFENTLSIRLMKLLANGKHLFLVEDESRNIGSRHIPPVFFEQLSQAPIVLLEATLEERIDITLQEYVDDALAAFRASSGDGVGFKRWAAYLQAAIDRIRRRLGGERHAAVKQLLDTAITLHAERGDTDAHRAWIEFLLLHYYDGMYEYQLDRKRDRIVHQGDRESVKAVVAERFGISDDPSSGN